MYKPLFPVDTHYVLGIPINYHPGAFGFKRRKNYHTGVDIYVEEGTLAYPCEEGKVVKVEQFTGGEESPWWNETWAVMVEGQGGVINYGELKKPDVKVGDVVCPLAPIGEIHNVIFPHRARPDIPGHSIYMLHFELYGYGAREFAHWHHEGGVIKRDPLLRDPFPYLLQCQGFPLEKLVCWDNPDNVEVG